MLSATGVTKGRGWTDTMVRDLLGEPDKTAPNPYYYGAAAMRLYDLDRVLQAETTDEFRSRMEAAAQRRARIKARAERQATEPRPAEERYVTPIFRPDGRLASRRERHAHRTLKKHENIRTNTGQGRNRLYKDRITDAMRKHIKARAEHRCSYCEIPDRGDDGPGFNLDHVVPRAAGGLNTENNLVWSCVPCNTRKAAMPVEVFLREKPEQLVKVFAQLGLTTDGDQAAGTSTRSSSGTSSPA